MSYSLIDIPKENYQRLVTAADPLYIPLGALSGTDASFLQGSVTVAAFGAGSATINLQESLDGGVTWRGFTAFAADTITATGTFRFGLVGTTFPLSPVARLLIAPAGGTSLYLSKVSRTFATSDIMAITSITSTPQAGLATEATLQAVLAALTSGNVVISGSLAAGGGPIYAPSLTCVAYSLLVTLSDLTYTELLRVEAVKDNGVWVGAPVNPSNDDFINTVTINNGTGAVSISGINGIFRGKVTEIIT